MFEIGRSPESMDKAFFALEDLKTQQKSNLFIFNIVLGGCANGKDIDRTFATFAEAENLGVVPNLDSYHMLLELCTKTRQGKVAERVWSELGKSGLEPNAETYSRYVDANMSCGNTHTGMGLALAGFVVLGSLFHTLSFSLSLPLIAKEIFTIAAEKKMRLSEGVYVRLITYL